MTNNMKGKIFNAQEVQAIIAGNKTQFREVIKQPFLAKCCKSGYRKNEMPEKSKICDNTLNMRQGGMKCCDCDNEIVAKCPYQVGQKIFVKEKFIERNDGIYYNGTDFTKGYLKYHPWSLPQHMKQKQSRLTLQIKEIKVERLQDISEEDAIVEGIDKLYSEDQFKEVLKDHFNSTNPWKNYLWYGLIGREITRKQSETWENQYSSAESAKDSFASLWNATHKKPEEKFEESPFVWKIEFEVVKNE